MIKCTIRGCRDIRNETRWILLTGPKKNKPPELLYEVKRICNECARTVNTAHLSEHQMSDKQKEEFGYYEAKAQVGKEAEG